jgi:hypothetical protein
MAGFLTIAAAKALTKVLTPEHLRRGQHSCDFEAPETPKALTSHRMSGDERLRKNAAVSTASSICL